VSGNPTFASLVVSLSTADTDQSCAPHVDENVCNPDHWLHRA